MAFGLQFFIFFLISYFSIPQIVKIAIKRNLIDKPDHRKIHRAIIPALGGIAIFISISLAYIFQYRQIELQYIYLYTGAFIIFFIGLIDDVIPQKAILKLGLQILSASIIVILGDIRIYSLFGTFDIYQLNYLISIFISIFIILTFINALNLIDGINGLAASLGIFYFSFFAYFYYSSNHILFFTISISFIASLLAFLKYNLIKPIIFLGDTGSTIIGLFSSIFLIDLLNSNSDTFTTIGIYCPYGLMLSMFILPLFDTFRVAIQRIIKQKSPFSPDKTHIHHLFIRLNFKHYLATGILLFFNILIFTISYLFQRELGDLLILTLILGIFVLSFFILEYFILSKFKKRNESILTYDKFKFFVSEYWFLFFSMIVFALPFQRWATSIPILLYSIIWLFSINISDFKSSSFSNIKRFTPIVLFLLPLFYFFFSYNIEFTWSKLGLYFPFLLFPFLLFLRNEYFDLKKWYAILAFFLLGILTFSGVFFSLVCIKFFSENASILFEGNRLFLSNIPILYFSLFLNFGIMTTIYLQKSHIKILQNQWISILIVTFFSMNIFVIHSKIGFIFMVLILTAAILIHVFNFKKIPRYAIVLFGILLFGFIKFYHPDKISISYLQNSSIEVSKRIQMWSISLDLISKKPIIGYGSNAEHILNTLTSSNLNCHNLYMQFWLEYGVLGILTILYTFGFSFFQAYKSKDFFYKGFLILTMSYGLFESLFSNQTGIVFFCIFNSLFLLKSELRIKTSSEDNM